MHSQEQQAMTSEFIPGLALGMGIGMCIVLAILIFLRLKNKSTDSAPAISSIPSPHRNPFENALVGYFTTDSRGKFLTMNLALAEILGFKDVPQAMSSDNFAPSALCADYERRVMLEQSIARADALDSFETKAHTKDGDQLFLRIFTSPKPIDGIEGMVEDITQQQMVWTNLSREKTSLEAKSSRLARQLDETSLELEEEQRHAQDLEYELERQKDQYRKLVDTMLDGLVLFDAFGRIGFCSNRFAQMLGTTKDAIQGKDSYELLDAQSQKTLAASMEHWKKSKSNPFELTWIGTGGKRVQTALSAWPVLDKRGRLAGGFAVITDITWKKEAEEALRKAKDEAEAASRAKSDFLAAMSHEIRTPMNAVLGFAEILENEISDELQLQHLAAIRNGGKALLGLINDILDLSRIEAGKLSLQPVPTDLRSLVREISNMFSKRASAKGLELPLIVDPALPAAVVIDANRIRQILINLLANAIKFTDKGVVELSVGAVPAANTDAVDIKLVVRDTGIGIPGDELLSIFEAFEQRKGQDSNKFGGSGLGLAITRRLVELMHGTIRVGSTVGRGSTFKVSIPSVPVAEAAKLDPASEQEMDVEFEPASILVVDDNATNRKLVRTWLEKYGMSVMEASDGRQGVEAAQQHGPAMVFMDRKMPVMTGDQALKAIRAQTKTRKIPVIAMSASVNKNSKTELLAMGYAGFIPKPISRRELMKSLEAHIPYKQLTPKPGSQESRPAVDSQGAAPAHSKIVNVQALLKSLAQQQPTWQRLVKVPVLDEIQDFAKKILAIGERHRATHLVMWSKQLETKAQGLDLIGLSTSLKEFPVLVQRIKTNA